MFTSSMTKRLINFYSYKKAQEESEEEQVADSVTGEVRPVSEMLKGLYEGDYLTEETYNRLFEIASLLGREYTTNNEFSTERIVSYLVRDSLKRKINELQPVVDVSGNWLYATRKINPLEIKKTINKLMNSNKETCVTDANKAPFWEFSNYRRFALVFNGICRVLWNADVYSEPLPDSGALGAPEVGNFIEHINEMTEGWITPNQCKFLGVIINDSEPIPDVIYSILEQEGIPILTHAEVATDHEYIDTKFYSKDDEYLDHFTCDVNDPESSYDIPEIDEEFYGERNIVNQGAFDISDVYNNTVESKLYTFYIYIEEGMYSEAFNLITSGNLSRSELIKIMQTTLPNQLLDSVFYYISNNEEISGMLIPIFLTNQPIDKNFIEKYKNIISKEPGYSSSIIGNSNIDLETKLEYMEENNIDINVYNDYFIEKSFIETIEKGTITPQIVHKYKNYILENQKIINAIKNYNPEVSTLLK
jgi:hypothetical protein